MTNVLNFQDECPQLSGRASSTLRTRVLKIRKNLLNIGEIVFNVSEPGAQLRERAEPAAANPYHSDTDVAAAWYGITEPRDVAFFSVHMTADVDHAATAQMLLDQLCDTPEKCEQARLSAARTLERLYEFLDAVTVN